MNPESNTQPQVENVPMAPQVRSGDNKTVILVLVAIIVALSIAFVSYIAGSQSVGKDSPSANVVPVVTTTAQPAATDNEETALVQQANLNTTNWKSYQNKTYGYQLKHPGLNIMTYSDYTHPAYLDSQNFALTDSSGNEKGTFSVVVWDRKGKTIASVQDMKNYCSYLASITPASVSQRPICSSEENFEAMDMQGNTAFGFSGAMDNTWTRTVFVPHGNYVYQMTYPSGEKTKQDYTDVANMMFITFGFTQ